MNVYKFKESLGLYNEFQGSQGCIERPGLQKGEETEEKEKEEGKERN